MIIFGGVAELLHPQASDYTRFSLGEASCGTCTIVPTLATDMPDYITEDASPRLTILLLACPKLKPGVNHNHHVSDMIHTSIIAAKPLPS